MRAHKWLKGLERKEWHKPKKVKEFKRQLNESYYILVKDYKDKTLQHAQKDEH